jgi:hypothetical protein
MVARQFRHMQRWQRDKLKRLLAGARRGCDHKRAVPISGGLRVQVGGR